MEESRMSDLNINHNPKNKCGTKLQISSKPKPGKKSDIPLVTFLPI